MIPTTRDEARTDLFLAGGVYWIGPTIIGLLLRVVPLPAMGRGATFVGLGIEVLCTITVPILMMRYRKERLADLFPGAVGAVGGVRTALACGAGIIVVGILVGALVVPGRALSVSLVPYAVGAVRWLSIGFLAAYAVAKATEAFGSATVAASDATARIARVVALVAAVAAMLVLAGGALRGTGLGLFDLLRIVGVPAAVALAVWLAARDLRGTTTMATLLAPTILLPLRPFALSFSGAALLQSLVVAAVYAGFGLAAALLWHRYRALGPALALGACMAALSPVA